MNEDPPKTPNRLRWAFWLLFPLAAQATVTTVIATQKISPCVIINAQFAGVICGVIVNLLCSPLAGYYYALYQKLQDWRARHVLGWSVLFFGLNIVLLPAGCGIGGLLGRAIGK